MIWWDERGGLGISDPTATFTSRPAVVAGQVFIPTLLPDAPFMTDKEINYETMALAVRKLLQQWRPQWEPLYGKMVADFAALDAALTGLDAKVQARGSQGSEGYTQAKDRAEIKALDSAMPVLQGVKALFSDGNHPALAKLAAFSRSSIDDLRGLVQVAVLEELHTQARARATELADERVTTAQLDALRDDTAAYKPLIDAPH